MPWGCCSKSRSAQDHGLRNQRSVRDACELNGRWGDGLVLLFKKIVALATKEGRYHNGVFATYWKRRLFILSRTSMITHAQQALRAPTHGTECTGPQLHMEFPSYEDFEEPENDIMEL